MMAALSFLLALLGLALLAVSQAKHYRDLFGTSLSVGRGRALRATGWPLLAASLAGMIAAQGLAIGIVLWTGLINVAALIVGLSIAYSNQWRRT